MNPNQSKFRPTARWLCYLIAGLVALSSLHCFSKAERACKSDQDCPSTSPKRNCFQGFCSTQACVPKQKVLCFDGPSEKANKGICRSGTKECSDEGQWLPCIGQVLPQTEICDRSDNNCDGQIDKNPPGSIGPQLDCTCTPGTKQICYSGPKGSLDPTGDSKDNWQCKQGIQYCELDNLWGPCYAESPPTPEVCDKIDNNCNGQIDEGINCNCQTGASRDCPNNIPNRGICQTGTQRCGNDNTWDICTGEQRPAAEVCDGKDNDCNGTTDGPRLDCTGSLLCLGGVCSCPPPLVECKGKCTTTDQNGLNCGQCGNVCPAGSVCDAGTCTCPNNQVACKGACTSTQTDARHCGGCDNACKEKEYCDTGTCQRCPANAPSCGETCCQGAQQCCGKRCADTQSDAANCGSCGNTCNQGELCCGGKCVDVSSDPTHCGKCQSNGQPTCSSTQKCCAGKCTGDGDPLHCGACGKPCAAGESCCKAGCVSVQNDPLHCGGCGKQCKSGEACCGLDGCTDTKSNNQHCGGCNAPCKADEVCCGGICHYKECPGAQSFTSAGLASLQGVALDRPNHQIYLLGNYTNNLTITCGTPANPAQQTSQIITSRGGQDLFLIKLDLQGKCLWLRGAGGTGDDKGWAIATGDDGYAHITGAATSDFAYYSSAKTIFPYTNTQSLTAKHVAFILSIRPDGDPVTTLNTPDLTSDSVGYDIAVKGDRMQGFCYITGEITSTNKFGGHQVVTFGSAGPGMFVAGLFLGDREFKWAYPKVAQGNASIGYGIDYSRKTDEVGVVSAEVISPSSQVALIQTIDAAPLYALKRRGSFNPKAPKIGWLSIAAGESGDWFVTGHGSATLGKYVFTDGFITRWTDATPTELKTVWANQIPVLHLASRAIVVDAKDNAFITGGFEEIGLNGKPRFGVAYATYDGQGNQKRIVDVTATGAAQANGLVLLPPSPLQAEGQLLIVGQYLQSIDFAPPRLPPPPATNANQAGFTWNVRPDLR